MSGRNWSTDKHIPKRTKSAKLMPMIIFMKNFARSDLNISPVSSTAALNMTQKMTEKSQKLICVRVRGFGELFD